MRGGLLTYLTVFLPFMVLSSFSNCQNSQIAINEKNLTRTWKLVSDMIVDLNPDFIPKDTLKLKFLSDHTCKGIIVNHDTTLTGSWVLDGTKLMINYKTMNGERKTKEYTIYELTQNKLVLMHIVSFGGALRTFVPIE